MSAIRMTFLTIAAIILAGIWLTGLDQVHWLIYVPPALLTFAALTGICPGHIVWSKLGFKSETLATDLPSAKPSARTTS